MCAVKSSDSNSDNQEVHEDCEDSHISNSKAKCRSSNNFDKEIKIAPKKKSIRKTQREINSTTCHSTIQASFELMMEWNVSQIASKSHKTSNRSLQRWFYWRSM